jgi:hypothetical protein
MILRTICVCVVLSAAGSATLADQPVIWLEAEHFAHPGGWVNDAQFIDQMGSPYLLAVGLGTPVEDATTELQIPEPGRYRLWVRTMDWLPAHHPGPFRVLLGGTPVEHDFGLSGMPGWRWEDGGVHKLDGNLQVALRDLTGYYARCDALCLSANLDWVPPADGDALAQERIARGGVSHSIQQMPRYDIVVVGGGLAGCTAAVAAARNGARTALIQNRGLLGGNASTEILVPPVGVSPGIYRSRFPLDPCETGFVEEYRTAGNQRIREGKLYSKRLDRFVRLESNLDLFLNTHATGVQMEEQQPNRIAAVLTLDVRTGSRKRFPGEIFIDCTGDAVIGVAAGAEYRHGKEPKSTYNEPWAPEVASKHTMGNGLKYFPVETDSPHPFAAPDWIYKFESCDAFSPGRHPRLPVSNEIGYQWVNELGGTRDTYADAEEIRDDLLRLVYGLWDHTKNHCDRDQERAKNYRLDWVGYVAGKRENRRLIGDYVLTQNDIGDQTLFRDRVAFGGWLVDDHYSEGFFHKGTFGPHYDDRTYAYTGRPYSIPYRCLYSKNVENLLMAGRNISASHLALANTRVMLTCAVIGHAVGTSAGLCIELGMTPRDVQQNHMPRLQQQLLKEGAHLIALRADDPRDKARSATVTASSEGWYEGELQRAQNVINGYARATDQSTNAWNTEAGSSRPHWIQLVWEQPIAFNVVHVAFQTVDLCPQHFAVETWNGNRWQRCVELNDNRHRRHVLGLEDQTTSRLRIVLNRPAAICEVRVYQESQREVDIARRAHCNMRLPDVGPWLPWPEHNWKRHLAGIVVDDEEAERRGVWTPSTWAEPFAAQGYVHDGNQQKGEKSILFRLPVPKPGTYELRVSYVPAANRASNTPVTVGSLTGVQTISLDQRKKPPLDGMFISLGSFELDQDSTVLITNHETDGYVVADAVQLLEVDGE